MPAWLMHCPAGGRRARACRAQRAVTHMASMSCALWHRTRPLYQAVPLYLVELLPRLVRYEFDEGTATTVSDCPLPPPLQTHVSDIQHLMINVDEVHAV